MTRSRISSVWIFLWGGLLFLSFRPVAWLERALEPALVPLRWVAELGSPLGWVRAGEVAAAERELAGAARDEAAEGVELLELLARRALPSEPRLRVGRAFLSAEVVERPSKDECWIQFAALSGVQRGSPVVCGDAFVGRVLETRPGTPALARVRLVTERSFRVGAEVPPLEESAGDPTYLTVGGVRVPRRSDPRTVRLVAHQPSASLGGGGIARVHELFADADDSAGLAEGFKLGEVRRQGERDDCWVEPVLDYLDGLFQVAIVVPENALDPSVPAARPALQDGQWTSTRALTFGDPSSWRSTCKIPLGRSDGLRAGAAVCGTGARLIGRVDRVGGATSDVALLDDPGFTLAVIARIEGLAEPCILGRLASLGRGPEGTIRMRWWVRMPIDLEARSVDAGSVRARLFSGSGDPGLPGGLFLGESWIPTRATPGQELEILLSPDVAPAHVRTLFVRREGTQERP